MYQMMHWTTTIWTIRLPTNSSYILLSKGMPISKVCGREEIENKVIDHSKQQFFVTCMTTTFPLTIIVPPLSMANPTPLQWRSHSSLTTANHPFPLPTIIALSSFLLTCCNILHPHLPLCPSVFAS